MNVENRSLVTDEPVEFEKQPVEVQEFKKSAHHQNKTKQKQKIYKNIKYKKIRKIAPKPALITVYIVGHII